VATGRLTTFPTAYGPVTGISTMLSAYTTFWQGNGVVVQSFTRGARSGGSAGVLALTVSGRRARLWDGQFFGIILVIPRVKNLGPVVSQTSFPIEVWNADEVPHRGTGYGIVGSSGVTLTNGITLPGSIAPFSSVFWTAVVDGNGDAIIDTIVTFVFPGFTGTDCQILGFRVLVYPLAPLWDREFAEEMGYATGLLRARDGTEQRWLLRAVPQRTLKFTGFTADVATTGDIMTRLFMGGQFLFAVPYWPDGQHPTSAVGVAATTINVDTTTGIFAQGGLVILWRNEAYWESYTVASVTPSTVVLASPTTKAFTVADFIVPALAARPDGPPTMSYPAPGKAEITVSFTAEPT